MSNYSEMKEYAREIRVASEKLEHNYAKLSNVEIMHEMVVIEGMCNKLSKVIDKHINGRK